MNPGSSYGLGGANHMRMNLGTSRKLVERALTNIGNGAEKHVMMIRPLIGILIVACAAACTIPNHFNHRRVSAGGVGRRRRAERRRCARSDGRRARSPRAR